MVPTALDVKCGQVQGMLRELKSVAVAFSAGVDSALLLKLAVETLGPRSVVAVTGRSDSLAQAELEEAGRLCAQLGVEHMVLDTREFDDPNYTANPKDRCYFCKTALYKQLERLVADRGLGAMLSGTNADDLGDFRPGIRAGQEHEVRSPLAEAGITKAEVRELSRRFGLPTHDKPASPCLSSRIPYGETVTREKLRMIEQAEVFLRRQFGIGECRVRHHGDLARIEVPRPLIAVLADPHNAAQIERHLRSLGYKYVTLDLRGFRSGSLNEVLALE